LVLRTNLYKHIFDCKDDCHITDLDFYKNKIIEIDKLKHELNNKANELENFKGTNEQMDFLKKRFK